MPRRSTSSRTGPANYVFSVKIANGGDGVWSLRVREAPGVAHPLLVDTQRLGLLDTGAGSVLCDPYSAMTTNQVKIRAEIDANFHVRNIGQGANPAGGLRELRRPVHPGAIDRQVLLTRCRVAAHRAGLSGR